MHERRRCATTSCEPLAQLVEHRPFKPRVVGSIPTRLTLEDLILAREILRALRGRKRSRRLRQQTVSKRRRIFWSDARDGVAKIVDGEVTVRTGRGGHGRVPQDPLPA